MSPRSQSSISLPRLAQSGWWGRALLLCLLLLGATPGWAIPSLLTFRGFARTLDTSGFSGPNPTGLAVTPNGTLYAADAINNRILTFTPQGVGSVVAMTGLATPLSSPRGVAVDPAGNLYLADTGNNQIVKVTPAGAATVVDLGGLVLTAPQGVVLDQAGSIFIADTTGNRIIKVPAGGAAAAFAITGLGTPLSGPAGLAFDPAGNFFIADAGNGRIVKVAAGGTAGTVVAISGGITLNQPAAVAADFRGNLYIADANNHRVVLVDAGGAGFVLPTPGYSLGTASGLVVDVLGTVYVADATNGAILAVATALNPALIATDPGYSLNKTAVNFGHLQLGTSTATTLNLPFSIGAAPVLGAFKVFTSGTENLDFRVNASATTATSGMTNTSAIIAVDFLPTAPGLRTGAVVLYDNATPANVIMTVPIYGYADAPVAALSPNVGTIVSSGGVLNQYPFQMALDGAGNMYVGNYVQANTNPKVTRIPAGGGTATVISTAPVTLGNSITGIAVDGAGNIFIADYYQSRIVVVTPDGGASVLSISGLAPALGEPTELCFDAAGNLYIADYSPNARVVQVSGLKVAGSASSGAGKVVGTGSYTFGNATLTGVAVDLAGTVYIAARTSNTSHVVQVTAAGVASLLNPTGFTFSNPQGATVDGFGNLYVVDSGNSRIVRITPAGAASAFSVSGLTSPTTLSSGFGVTVDPNGNLYIPDWTNNRIVFVNVGGAAMTYLSTKQGFTSTDSPKTAVVTNLGNQALTFPTDPTYTADFSNNSGDTNPITSTTTLAPGLTGNVSVKFTPQSVGSLSAGITVTNNTLNVPGSTQQVSVSGTGVNPGDTTATVLTFSPTALTNGQPVTVTATVSDTQAGHTSTIPTGAVSFTDTFGSSTTTLSGGSSVALSGGKAILSGVVLSGVGTHSITASYAGITGTYLTSTHTNTITITKAAAVLAGPAQPFTVTALNPATFNVTLTGPYAYLARPTGTVAWNVVNAANTSVASGTATLAAGATASTTSWTVPALNLPVGTFTATATYSGDGNYLASATPASITLVVSQLTPTVTLASSANPSKATSQVTFTAGVSGAGPAPTGTVAFYDGTTLLGSGTLASGVATYATSALAPKAAHAITAVYGGDATYTTLTSAGVTQAVNQLTPTAALTSTPNPAIAASLVTFKATLTGTGPTPTGTVAFYDGTTLLGSGTLASGVATYATAGLAPGVAHAISAVYGGDVNYTILTSATLPQNVAQLVTAVALTSSKPTGPAYLGLPVTFTATVTNPISSLATGSVAFMDGTTLLGTVTLSQGVATYTTSGLPLGDHAITAIYGGDPANAGAASTAIDQVIATPVVVIANPPAPVTVENGGTATTQLTLSSLGVLGTPITFTVTGLPAGASCSFDNNAVNVAGGPVVVNVTITTTPRLLIIGRNLGLTPAKGGLGAGFLLVGFLALPSSRRRKKLGLFLSILALGLLGNISCSASGQAGNGKGITTGAAGTPAGTYTITVTANSQGATPVTSTIQLNVN